MSEEAEYNAAVERALSEYAQGNWPEAKVFFAKAHALRPSARTLRGLGLTSYEMRSYVAACDFLRLALDSREKPLTDQMRAQVEAALRDAESFVARYRVVVQPETATLEIDDRPPVLREGWVLLDPGTHLFSVRAQGFKPASRTLVVQGGERNELRFGLEPEPSAQAAAPVPAPLPAGQAPREQVPAELKVEEPSPPAHAAAMPAQAESEPGFWNTQRTIALGVAIGAVGAAGVGTAFFVLAANQKSLAEDKGCMENLCPPEGFPHYKKAADRAHVATYAFVTAGVLLATAGVLYFTADSPEQPPRTVSLQPELSLTSAGLAVAGRW